MRYGLFLLTSLTIYATSRAGVIPRSIRIADTSVVRILSVGISEYKLSGGRSLLFKNAASDAKAFADSFAKLRPASKLETILLLNEQATKENIVAALNRMIASCKKEDIFIFNYCGYSAELKDSSGREESFIVSFGNYDLTDTSTWMKDGISMPNLKELTELILSERQLFVTEAGSGESFNHNFIRALLDTKAEFADLSKRERILITPSVIGLDEFYCNKDGIHHGPLNHMLLSILSSGRLNISEFFKPGSLQVIQYELNKQEFQCDFSNSRNKQYAVVLSQRSYLEILGKILPGKEKSRGGDMYDPDAPVPASISKKLAVFICTDNFKYGFSALSNPIRDAEKIGKIISEKYGFDTLYLRNKPMTSIYAELAKLAQQLDSNSQLLVYVSGHGDYDEKFLDDGYIVTHDSKSIKDDPYRKTFISFTEFAKILNRMKCKQAFVALDICFGGAFNNAISECRERDAGSQLDATEFLSTKLVMNTRKFMTSGGINTVPDGLDKRLSPFAQMFIQALNSDGGQDGILTAHEIFTFVETLKSKPRIGSFGEDVCGSEFVMVTKK